MLILQANDKCRRHRFNNVTDADGKHLHRCGWDFDTPNMDDQGGVDYPRLAWRTLRCGGMRRGHGDRVPESGRGERMLDGSCSSDADSNDGTNENCGIRGGIWRLTRATGLRYAARTER